MMSSITRRRAGEKKYKEYRKAAGEGCDFCKLQTNDGQVARELEYGWVARARFPYDFWDSAGVTDHLMIIPKRHVVSLKDYNKQEREEYFNVLAEYEERGYSIYSRGVAASTRTVAHVHTHLIKHGKHKKAVLYIHKPHLMVSI
jgi:hypothetical protein